MSCTGLLGKHKLELNLGGRIKCEKCKGMWDLDGRELIPYGYLSWKAWQDECFKKGWLPASAPESHWSGKNPLSTPEIALALADGIIKQKYIKDQTEIKAIQQQAVKDPDAFINMALGRVR